MSTTVFNDHYSSNYDSFYASKNYTEECDLVLRQFEKFGMNSVEGKNILDLGCGTGGHLVQLLKRGALVCGVDLSGSMLGIAQQKMQEGGFSPKSFQLLNNSVGDFSTSTRFDAAIMMFAVLGYLGNNSDIIMSLRNVRKHLEKGALFFCDFWYGPAVLSEKPSDRVRILNTSDAKVVRAVNTALDVNNSMASVKIDLISIDRESKVKETCEVHKMRYFFESELNLLFDLAGFEVLKVANFSNENKQPDLSSWNVFLIAKAK